MAKHSGISRSRIGQIIKRESQRAQAAERSAAIRNDIRASGGLDRKRPIDDLMDLLIPVVESLKELRDAMPGYRVGMLGQVLHAELIKAMSAVDCGEVLRAEWTERKRRLREYLVGSGGFYPCILNGEGAALASTS